MISSSPTQSHRARVPFPLLSIPPTKYSSSSPSMSSLFNLKLGYPSSHPSSPVLLPLPLPLTNPRSSIRRWVFLVIFFLAWLHLRFFPFSLFFSSSSSSASTRIARESLASSWPTEDTEDACRAQVLLSKAGLVAPDGFGAGSVLRVKAVPSALHFGDDAEIIADNEIHALPFLPFLSDLRSSFFTASITNSPPSPLSHPSPSSCLVPTISIEPSSPPSLPPSPLSTVPAEPTLFFSFCTTPSRVVSYSHTWTHFLRPVSYTPSFFNLLSKPVGQPGCIVIDAQGNDDRKGKRKANKALRKADTTCEMRDSSTMKGGRYELRVLASVKDAWDEAEKQRLRGGPFVEWFVFSDDDTWWMDLPSLKAHLSTLSYEDDHFLGAFTETISNMEQFGKIAFGGAGMVLSRSMAEKLVPLIPTCAEKFQEFFGGDAMLTSCVALARGIQPDDTLENTPGFSQMDMKGDGTGYLNFRPHSFITLHHWAGWLELIPNRDQPTVIELFRKGVEGIGARNMFRRWAFDEGAVLWSVGYAVTVYRDGLTPTEFEEVERTWEEHIPFRPSRPNRPEGLSKLTYYITSVEQISPTQTLFVHTCSDPSVQDSLPTISIIWDTTVDLPKENGWDEERKSNERGGEGQPWWVFGGWQTQENARGLRNRSSGRGERKGLRT